MSISEAWFPTWYTMGTGFVKKNFYKMCVFFILINTFSKKNKKHAPENWLIHLNRTGAFSCYIGMKLLPSTTLFITLSIPFIRVTEMLKSIPANFGQEVGYTLGWLPHYHRANTETNSQSHIWTFKIVNWLTTDWYERLWDMRVNLNSQKKHI